MTEMEREMNEMESNEGVGRSHRWNYACQICGAAFESKPEFCYECGRGTVVPVEYVME